MNNTITKEDANYRKLEQFQDRCDRCSAQSFARAVKISDDNSLLELLFCGHHFRTHGYRLGLEGWLLQDNTDEINLKPSDFEE